MGASILALALLAWPKIADLKTIEEPSAQKDEKLLEEYNQSNRPEMRFICGPLSLSLLPKRTPLQPGEWRETVSKFLDPEEAKLEYGNEILKVLLRNTSKARAFRNQAITHIGFYDEEATKNQERIAPAKARIELERDLYPWQEFMTARP
jgi:hypothetical protein